MAAATDAVIVSAVRTPFGKFGGALREVPSHRLGAIVIQAALRRAGVDGARVDEVYYGSCLHAETALATNIPARQAILQAGPPPQTVSLTIDRACCSSMTAVQLAARALRSGEARVVLAAGAENMSRAPFLLPGMRWGHRLGHPPLTDPLFAPGYPDWTPVAVDAGTVAVAAGISRHDQDCWAVRSQERYQQARDAGFFDAEIEPVTLAGGQSLAADEFPKPGTTLAKLSALPTVYGSPTVTAGNAPGMDAGAAALVLMRRDEAERRGLAPLARVVAAANVAAEPHLLARVPALAIEAVLKRANLPLAAMDRIEINEAFAAVPLVSARMLSGGDPRQEAAIHDRLNVNGGAIAIGHPIGASGARLVMTLLYELQRCGGRYGVAAICGGLAQGDAVVIEVPG